MIARPLIFGYWNSDDHAPISTMITAWRQAFPDFRIVGDGDVRPLLKEHDPDVVSLYDAIRLPSCKSDVARFAMLYETGGFYVDCHVGLRSAAAVKKYLKDLSKYELIVFDRYGAPDGRIVQIVNGFLFARARSPIIAKTLKQALANLKAQHRAQLNDTHSPYDVWTMTGPGVLNEVITRRKLITGRKLLKPRYRGRVKVVPEVDAPVVRNIFRDYKGKGQHWSQRQRTEPLFELADP